MRRSWVVWVAALVAVLGRWPGLLWPPYPDEAGFLTVAMHWDTGQGTVYGHYFVDRPPILIGVYWLANQFGGIGFLRAATALTTGGFVLIAAALARQVSRDPKVAGWTAVAAAAFVSARRIDPIAAQGEIMALPLITASIWLALRALRLAAEDRPDDLARSGDRALSPCCLASFGAGLCATLAVGLKQNLATGLVFGAVALITARVSGAIDTRRFGLLAAAATAGAATPLLGVVIWALGNQVPLSELWYDVYGFRSDALQVLNSAGETANEGRLLNTACQVVLTGLAPVAIWFVMHGRSLLRANPPATAGGFALLAFDGASLALGGSYWPPYVFGLVPATILFTALLLAADGRAGLITRVIALLAVLSTGIGMLSWLGTDHTTWSRGYATGVAIGAAAAPGDTIQVYGGRADVRLASGLTQEYPYLWSLPMRTLDPDLARLKSELASPERPTWLVLEVSLKGWGLGERTGLGAVIEANYQLHSTGCDDEPVYLRKGLDRARLVCPAD